MFSRKQSSLLIHLQDTICICMCLQCTVALSIDQKPSSIGSIQPNTGHRITFALTDSTDSNIFIQIYQITVPLCSGTENTTAKCLEHLFYCICLLNINSLCSSFKLNRAHPVHCGTIHQSINLQKKCAD